ncbi:MAG TPA: DUF433 domain-containing protein [Alloacidobacterium sp.]|nr:DUF433 domain-containing protein [Alloacidobacterium sp.]
MKRRTFDPLYLPNYGLEEAVRYLHIPRSTLHFWMAGKNPLLSLADPQKRLLSFKNLVELYVLKGLREIHRVRLSAVRDASEYLKENWPSSHPFADYDLQTDGIHVYFWDKSDCLYDVSGGGQMGLPSVMDEYLKRINRDAEGLANALHPYLTSSSLRSGIPEPRIISIDPNICFGMPVLAGTRITTAMLTARYKGGDSIPAIAKSYGRPEDEIAAAIRWTTGSEKAA